MCRLIHRKHWIGRVSEAQNIHISQKVIERKGKWQSKQHLIKFHWYCAFLNCDRFVASGDYKIIQKRIGSFYMTTAYLFGCFVCCFKLFSHWTSSFRFAMDTISVWLLDVYLSPIAIKLIRHHHNISWYKHGWAVYCETALFNSSCAFAVKLICARTRHVQLGMNVCMCCCFFFTDKSQNLKTLPSQTGGYVSWEEAQRLRFSCFSMGWNGCTAAQSVTKATNIDWDDVMDDNDKNNLYWWWANNN